MARILAALAVVGTMVIQQGTVAKTQQAVVPNTANSGAGVSDSSAKPPGVLSVPVGRSTILGGEIVKVDPFNDAFVLRIYGQRPAKILFDNRTQVYRDGAEVPIRELGPEAHASVQTVLDGGHVFAISVHILSRPPEGELRGRVRSYDPFKRELTIDASISQEPVKLTVDSNTHIARTGQPSFVSQFSGATDLIAGSLISVTFAASESFHDTASQIAVLAVPNTDFVFSGNIKSVDMRSGSFVLTDLRTEETYEVYFDPSRISVSRNLRSGSNVRLDATYDGSRYMARTITVNQQ